MTVDTPSSLVPNLRFAEFRDSGEWETRKLGDVISRGKETFDPQKSRDSPHVIELEHIESKTGRILGVAELEKRSSLKSRFQAGDVLFGKLRPYLQKFARPDFQGVCTSEIWVLRSKDVSSAFLFYLVQTERFIQLANISSGSRMPRAEWSFLAGADFAIPHPDEQQKIADCLGSLDDLIAAEGRKLEALRQHKQGLMQKIFPQLGETVPRLRFPEFRDADEWEEKKIGDVSDVLMCKRIFASQTNPSGGVPFYKIGTLGGEPDAFISKDLFEEYKSKYNFPRPGEILITCSGTVGKCLAYDGSEAYFQDSNIVWIDNPTLEVSNELLLNILSNVNWSTLNSTTITRIYGPDLRGLAVKFPHNEQEQKSIADCLSALDTRIAAQLAKLNTLRTHKQGLMQQLFPSLEGH